MFHFYGVTDLERVFRAITVGLVGRNTECAPQIDVSTHWTIPIYIYIYITCKFTVKKDIGPVWLHMYIVVYIHTSVYLHGFERWCFAVDVCLQSISHVSISLAVGMKGFVYHVWRDLLNPRLSSKCPNCPDHKWRLQSEMALERRNNLIKPYKTL